MKISLHWKLTIVFCLMATVILGAAYFYLNTRLKDFLEQDIKQNLDRELLLNKDFLERELKGELTAGKADEVADRIGSALGVRATIIAPDGTVLGDSEIKAADIPAIENHLDRPEVQQALKGGYGHSQRYSYTLKKYMYYSAIPIGTDKTAAILRLVVPVSSIAAFEAEMQRILVAAMAVLFAVAFILSYLISLVITRPLARIASAAKMMASGDFSGRVPVSSSDEIGELARTLNYMSDEIKAKIDTVVSGEARLDTVLSGMVEGVIVTDSKGAIALANPSVRKLFLIDTPPEGKTPLEVIRNSAVQDIVDRVLKQGERAVTREISIDKPDERSVMVSGVAIMKGADIRGAILVFHDITELRRLERIRQDFVANVSHELRTPLSSIKGYSETLLESGIKEAERKEFLAIIHRESDRLAKLIDDLLDLSKIESGKMAMVFLPIDVVPVVKRSAGVLEKSAGSKSINIEVDIPQGLPRVLADEGRLAQVLLNLLDNAVKYTPEGGSIRVSAAPQGNFVRIDVSDTGVGIPESDIPRIFERFYRVDKARSRELGGTGLGLSIVKHIVQAHGGQVWVVSEAGRGSTFSFTVPKA